MKDADLCIPDRKLHYRKGWHTDSFGAECLSQRLVEKGWDMIFILSTATEEEVQSDESNDFCIELPKDALTDTGAVNLNWISESTSSSIFSK